MGEDRGGDSRWCIVNVDDFGASAGINRGVVEAHKAGIVTSASMMVTGAAAAAAAHWSRQLPGLSVGLHVDFTGEAGAFRIDLHERDVAQRELLRQLEAFEVLVGGPPTHLDSHHHVHRRPALADLFEGAAEGLGVPLRDSPPVRYFGSFYGAWEGETHPEQVTFESLEHMLRGFGPGVTELATHIGYVDPDFDSEYHRERELELATILDPRLPALFASLGIQLIGYRELCRGGWR